MPQFLVRPFPLLRCFVFALACLLTACAGVPPRTVTPYAPGLPPSQATELGRLTAGFRHDPDGMVDSLLDDAQFVTVNGAWTTSKEGFRDLMRRLHGPTGPFRASTRDTPEMDVRFLGPDVAVAHTRFHIYGDVDEAERTSIGTRVVRKVDGRWYTVAVQNTDLRAGRRH